MFDCFPNFNLFLKEIEKKYVVIVSNILHNDLSVIELFEKETFFKIERNILKDKIINTNDISDLFDYIFIDGKSINDIVLYEIYDFIKNYINENFIDISYIEEIYFYIERDHYNILLRNIEKFKECSKQTTLMTTNNTLLKEDLENEISFLFNNIDRLHFLKNKYINIEMDIKKFIQNLINNKNYKITFNLLSDISIFWFEYDNVEKSWFSDIIESKDSTIVFELFLLSIKYNFYRNNNKPFYLFVREFNLFSLKNPKFKKFNKLSSYKITINHLEKDDSKLNQYKKIRFLYSDNEGF